MSNDHEELPAQTQLLMQKFVNAHIGKWVAIFGVSNVLAILAGLATIVFWVPEEAANLAAGRAQPALEKKADDVLDLIKLQIKDAESDLNALDQQVISISMQAGKVTGRSESLLEESARLQDTANNLRSILETTDFGAVTEFLGYFSNSDDVLDVLARLTALEEAGSVKVRLNRQGAAEAWTGNGSGFTSESYAPIWGPFEFASDGGQLLIHFDSSFTGNRLAKKRSWYRLVVNGEVVRTAMQHSGATWDLGTVAMSTVLSGLGEGTHTISVEAKTQAGGEISAPHHDPELEDEATKGLIVIELPGGS